MDLNSKVQVCIVKELLVIADDEWTVVVTSVSFIWEFVHTVELKGFQMFVLEMKIKMELGNSESAGHVILSMFTG